MAPNCPVAAAVPASNAASELTACCQPLRPTQQNLGSSRRSCNLQAGNVSATPSDESAAAFASTMAHARLKTLQPSALAAASRAESPTQFGQRATAPVERSDALGPSRRSCNFQAACSLGLNYPPPLLAAISLQPAVSPPHLRKPQAPTSPYEAV